jgi:ATP-dependent Lon protease
VEGQKIIRDNQSGISFDLLFGAYVEGAKNIKLTDPYIRLPYQLRNLMEFTKLVALKKDELDEVKLHLITNNNEEYIQNSKEAFEEMADSLESLGITFTYEFNEDSHDRSIEMDNGWKIVLGRGLDIYQKTNGWYDIAEYYQEKRLCKGCEVTYVSQKN